MNNPAPLAGIRVLVTRPRERADGLVAALRELGAEPRVFPTLAFAPAPPVQVEAQVAAAGDAFDMAIFTSPAAVAYGIPALGQQRLPGSMIAAIGPATAEALRAQGLVVEIEPRAGMDSEALLTQPALAAARVSGRRVVIVRGEGGRGKLAEILRQRGAEILPLEVYRRTRPPAATQPELPECDVVTITSMEIATNLLAMITPAQQVHIRSRPVVTVSKRIAAGLHQMGFVDKIAVAAGADDVAVAHAVRQLLDSDR